MNPGGWEVGGEQEEKRAEDRGVGALSHCGDKEVGVRQQR